MIELCGKKVYYKWNLTHILLGKNCNPKKIYFRSPKLNCSIPPTNKENLKSLSSFILEGSRTLYSSPGDGIILFVFTVFFLVLFNKNMSYKND